MLPDHIKQQIIAAYLAWPPEDRLSLRWHLAELARFEEGFFTNAPATVLGVINDFERQQSEEKEHDGKTG